MQHTADIHAVNSRMIQIVDELATFCEFDFETAQEELEHEFAELRVRLSHD